MSVVTAIRILPSAKSEGNWFRSTDKTITRLGTEDLHTFDHVFDAETNEEVFEASCCKMIESVLDGFNAAIAAYGQSGSGKTYSVIGSENDFGIVPLAIKKILELISKKPDTQYIVKMAAVEIYNEKLIDLLSHADHKNCKLIEDKLYGAIEEHVSSYEHFCNIFKIAQSGRKVGETKLNDQSSRSHAIFQFVVESLKTDNDSGRQFSTSSRLLIVDLAGSENSRLMSSGVQTNESKNINLSLLALSKLISKIAANPNGPKITTYRESKLTRILQPALGGNSKLLLLCCIRRDNCNETSHTINFCAKAKNIRNNVTRNEKSKDAELPKLLEQIEMLKQELEERENMTKKREEEEKRLEALRKLILNSNAETSRNSDQVQIPTMPKTMRRHSIAFGFHNARTITATRYTARDDFDLMPIGEEDVDIGKEFGGFSGRSSRMSENLEPRSDTPDSIETDDFGMQVSDFVKLEIDGLKSTIQELQQALAENEQRSMDSIAAEKEVNEKLKAEVSQLKIELEEEKQRFQTMMNEDSEKISAEKIVNSKLTAEIDRLKTQIDEEKLRSEDMMKMESEKVSAEWNAIKVEIASLKSQLEEEKRRSENTAKALSDEISAEKNAMAKRVDELTVQLEQERSKSEALLKEKLQSEEKAAEELEKLREKYNDMKKYGMGIVDGKKKENEMISSDLKKLREENDSMHRGIETLKHEKEQMKLEMEEKEKADRLEKERHREEYKTLKNKLESEQLTKSKLRNQMVEAEKVMKKHWEEEKRKRKQLENELNLEKDMRNTAENNLAETKIDCKTKNWQAWNGVCNNPSHFQMEAKIKNLISYRDLLIGRLNERSLDY